MHKEKVLEYANKTDLIGILPVYQGMGQCEESGCEDVLTVTINTHRDIITELGYTLTETACPPMKACARIAAEMAIGKPLLTAYLFNAKDIAAELGGLDKENIHCAMMAELAIKRCIVDCSKKARRFV